MVIYTYKITNKINGKYYIGIHKGDLEDDYMGSGILIKKAIKKYGKDSFKKDIIKIHSSLEEAWEHEKSIVTEETVEDPMCYNMHKGGRGGWDHVDIRGSKNPMHRPDVAKKVSESHKKLRKNNEHLNEVSRRNFRIAAEKSKGKKRPEHADIMRNIVKQLWKNENYRNKFKQRSSDKFTLCSPNGIIYEDVYLGDFCKKHGLPFTTLWNSAKQHGKLITKGKAEGWKCKYHNLAL
jgi:hypothetical protein